MRKNCSLGANRALFLAFLWPLLARAEWQVATVESKPCAAGAEYRRYSLGDPSSGDKSEIQLTLFSPAKAHFRVIDQPDFPSDLAEVVAREQGFAGVNGGYFDPDGAPVGLLRAEGKTISNFQRSRLLGGVLAVARGEIELFRASEFPRKRNWDAALQCGPFLIDRGKVVTGLEKTRRARRSLVAVLAKGEVAVGDCSPVTLAQLADTLVALSDLKISRAMNLDGGSSSAFFCLTKSGVVSISEEKRVRDFLVIAPLTSR